MRESLNRDGSGLGYNTSRPLPPQTRLEDSNLGGAAQSPRSRFCRSTDPSTMDFEFRSPATADLEARSTGSSETRFKMEDLPDSREGLMDMLEKLEEQKKAVLSALLKTDKPTVQKPTVQDIVVVFVEEIEKANQFFEFKRYLEKHKLVKPKQDAVENLKYLVKVLKVQENSRFNKLDFKQIMDAVEFYIVNRKKPSSHKQSIQGNTSCEVSSEEGNCWFSLMSLKGNTSWEVSSEEGNDWYSLMSLKERGLAQLIDPFLSLAYHIREKGHVMNEDPLLELEHIKKSDQLCYKRCIVRRLLRKCSERKVTAFCIPSHYEENDVKEALSCCGNVVSVELERRGNSANVTFEDSVAAKLATVIMNRTFTLRITPAYEKYEYQPKNSTEYEKAVIKYEEFRNYSKKSQTGPVQTPGKMNLCDQTCSRKNAKTRKKRKGKGKQRK